eukprot:scaffold26486_cov118-Isochrysis_galbana.AAC.8
MDRARVPAAVLLPGSLRRAARSTAASKYAGIAEGQRCPLRSHNYLDAYGQHDDNRRRAVHSKLCCLLVATSSSDGVASPLCKACQGGI